MLTIRRSGSDGIISNRNLKKNEFARAHSRASRARARASVKHESQGENTPEPHRENHDRVETEKHSRMHCPEQDRDKPGTVVGTVRGSLERTAELASWIV